jgi:transaldolase
MITSTDASRIATRLEAEVRTWVLQGFAPHYGRGAEGVESNPRWKALRDLGTELWLDTGDLKGSSALWTREFTALTTNNTLLNKEVQRGQYDDLVRRTAARLRELDPRLPDELLVLEIGFVLNAWHGLRLVEAYDAYVSVEEHTDLATDADLAVLYGKRFHAICPERFFVKLPLTPAGLLGMRRLGRDGVPVNFTLGFSARQNYLAARLGGPSYVNVFLGRLNSFVADSKLGSGDGVGEKATAASQEAIGELRRSGAAPTRQIAASMRSGEQVWTLAGVDVMTIPLQAAQEYRDAAQPPARRRGPSAVEIRPGIEPDALEQLHLDRLWDVPPGFRAAVDALLRQDLDAMSGPQLVAFLESHGITDLFPHYSAEEQEAIRTEGKIPKLERWQRRLEAGTTSLDSLLNVSGLASFATDQKALDDRIRAQLG